MAKTSTLTMSVSVVGDGVNESFNVLANNPVVNQTAPGGGPLAYPLNTGTNTIPVPPGSISMVIIPPPNSVVALTLKGAGGDTGFGLSPTLPVMVSIPSGTTSVIISAASPENVSILWL